MNATPATDTAVLDAIGTLADGNTTMWTLVFFDGGDNIMVADAETVEDLVAYYEGLGRGVIVIAPLRGDDTDGAEVEGPADIDPITPAAAPVEAEAIWTPVALPAPVEGGAVTVETRDYTTGTVRTHAYATAHDAETAASMFRPALTGMAHSLREIDDVTVVYQDCAAIDCRHPHRVEFTEIEGAPFHAHQVGRYRITGRA